MPTTPAKGRVVPRVHVDNSLHKPLAIHHLLCYSRGNLNKEKHVSIDMIQEIDERLWEMYLDELRSLSLENKVQLHPSMKDFHVWLQDQNYDVELGEAE